MTESAAEQQLESIIAKGFDKSYVYDIGSSDGDYDEHYDPYAFSVRVRCSQCEAMVINGVPCHETGCPNTVREMDDDDYDSEYNPEEE